MISKFEFFIAWRYLKAKKQESFISVVALFSLVGTALGVAALIVVMSVMAGFREELTGRLIGFVGDINIYSKGTPTIEDYPKLVDKVNQNPEVIYSIGVIEKQVLVSANQINIGVQLRGVSLEDLQKKSLVSKHIIAGSLDEFKEDSIIIGKNLAYNLNLDIDDSVKIISPQTTSTFIGNIPRFKTCYVAGIFDSGMSEFDSNAIFMPLQLAQTYFKLPNQVSVIEVATKNPNDADKLGIILDNDLNHEYKVIDWKQRNANLITALKTEKVAMFVILTLIMIVAAFNIISSLIMLVKDKTSDIAILRTMGSTKKMIIKIFFICGASIGTLGTIAGVILGVSFAANIESIRQFLQMITGTTIFDPLIYYLSFLPSKIYVADVINITGISLGLSFLATIYPAYRAAKLNPATALKY